MYRLQPLIISWEKSSSIVGVLDIVFASLEGFIEGYVTRQGFHLFALHQELDLFYFW
jgi:hypothetical protein